MKHSWLAAIAAVVLVGCPPANGGTIRGTTLGDEVEAPGPSAVAYSTRDSSGEIVAPGDEEAVRAGIARASASHRTTLAGDGRLALLAGYLAERIGDGATLPPAEVTRFFAYHLGLAEVTPHVVLVGVPDPARLADAVAEAVGQYLRRQRYDHVGATVIHRQGIRLAVVALSSRPFTMRDVPRTFAAPEPIAIAGELADGFRAPVIELVAPGSGASTRILAGDARTIAASLPITEPGEWEVRIEATSAAGTSFVARFPVYVGEAPPRILRLGAADPAPRGESAAEVEAALYARIDELRRTEGLPALERSDALAAVARAHSQDMVEHGFTAHVSPTTGSPSDRVRAANLTSGLVLENLGGGIDSADAHRRIAGVAQNRANLLNRDITHVGLGVVARTVRGREEFIVTEMFFRIPRAIDTAAAPATLLASINRARTARGATEAEEDPNLSRAAAEAAQRYLADASATDTEVLDEATGAVRRYAIAYRRVGGVLTVVSTLDEAATLEPTFDPAVGALGIGVAQGTRADLPPNSVVVVYLLAFRR